MSTYEPELSSGLEVAKEFISSRVRRAIYAIASILGYLLSATAIGFASAGYDVPVAVLVSMAVMGALIGPIGQLAATNTPSTARIETESIMIEGSE